MFKGKSSQNSKSSSKDSNEGFKDFLINDLPDGIAIITQDLTQCLFANQSFSTLCNTSDIKLCLKDFSIHEDGERKYQSEGSMKTLLDFVHYSLNHNDFKAGKKLSCIFTYAKENMSSNAPLVFEAKVFSKVWDSIPAVSIILHDMTEHYAEMDLKIKDVEIGATCHEYRTPLNGILGLVSIMQTQTEDSSFKHYLDVCNSQAHLLLSMINSSLDLQMTRTGKLRLVPAKFDLSKFLNEVVSLYKFQCGNKNIYLNLEISELTPKYLHTDRGRLSQILIHLMSNAVKFTFQGGITVSAKPSKDKKYVELTVKDTGIGIKEEEKQKLIKMVEKSLTRQQGVGLGLAISERLARLLGGEEQKAGLSITSIYQEGAVFSFWIKTKLVDPIDQSEYSVSSDEEEDEENNVDEIMGQHTMEKNPSKF